jgi:glycerophosphoryl diester phosphodiesterase
VIIYGHRGARGEAPENTVEGFEFAINQGIDRFELDVQLTKDGRMVVIHDPTLERTTGIKKKVFEMTSRELNSLDARKNTQPWPTPCHIPMLDELLEKFNSVKHWQLEVKTDDKSRLNILSNRLIEYIHTKHLFEKVVITSFDKWLLKEVKRRDKRIATGFITDNRFPNPIKTALGLNCQYLCLDRKLVDKSIIEQAHDNNLIVSSWTVNNLQEAIQFKNWGIDSIITDLPTSTSVYFEKIS